MICKILVSRVEIDISEEEIIVSTGYSIVCVTILLSISEHKKSLKIIKIREKVMYI